MATEGQRQTFWLEVAPEVTNQNQEAGPPHNLDAKIDKSVPKMIFRRMGQHKGSEAQYCVKQKIAESLKLLLAVFI